jgi:hypothetical protein
MQQLSAALQRQAMHDHRWPLPSPPYPQAGPQLLMLPDLCRGILVLHPSRLRTYLHYSIRPLLACLALQVQHHQMSPTGLILPNVLVSLDLVPRAL